MNLDPPLGSDVAVSLYEPLAVQLVLPERALGSLLGCDHLEWDIWTNADSGGEHCSGAWHAVPMNRVTTCSTPTGTLCVARGILFPAVGSWELTARVAGGGGAHDAPVIWVGGFGANVKLAVKPPPPPPSTASRPRTSSALPPMPPPSRRSFTGGVVKSPPALRAHTPASPSTTPTSPGAASLPSPKPLRPGSPLPPPPPLSLPAARGGSGSGSGSGKPGTHAAPSPPLSSGQASPFRPASGASSASLAPRPSPPVDPALRRQRRSLTVLASCFAALCDGVDRVHYSRASLEACYAASTVVSVLLPPQALHRLTGPLAAATDRLNSRVAAQARSAATPGAVPSADYVSAAVAVARVIAGLSSMRAARNRTKVVRVALSTSDVVASRALGAVARYSGSDMALQQHTSPRSSPPVSAEDKWPGGAWPPSFPVTPSQAVLCFALWATRPGLSSSQPQVPMCLDLLSGMVRECPLQWFPHALFHLLVSRLTHEPKTSLCRVYSARLLRVLAYRATVPSIERGLVVDVANMVSIAICEAVLRDVDSRLQLAADNVASERCLAEVQPTNLTPLVEFVVDLCTRNGPLQAPRTPSPHVDAPHLNTAAGSLPWRGPTGGGVAAAAAAAAAAALSPSTASSLSSTSPTAGGLVARHPSPVAAAAAAAAAFDAVASSPSPAPMRSPSPHPASCTPGSLSPAATPSGAVSPGSTSSAALHRQWSPAGSRALATTPPPPPPSTVGAFAAAAAAAAAAERSGVAASTTPSCTPPLVDTAAAASSSVPSNSSWSPPGGAGGGFDAAARPPRNRSASSSDLPSFAALASSSAVGLAPYAPAGIGLMSSAASGCSTPVSAASGGAGGGAGIGVASGVHGGRDAFCRSPPVSRAANFTPSSIASSSARPRRVSSAVSLASLCPSGSANHASLRMWFDISRAVSYGITHLPPLDPMGEPVADHAALVRCAVHLCSCSPLLREVILVRVLSKWPTRNSMHGLVLLGLLAQVLRSLTSSSDLAAPGLIRLLQQRLLEAMASPSVALASRALAICNPASSVITPLLDLPDLMAALAHGVAAASAQHWNASVRAAAGTTYTLLQPFASAAASDSPVTMDSPTRPAGGGGVAAAGGGAASAGGAALSGPSIPASDGGATGLSFEDDDDDADDNDATGGEGGVRSRRPVSPAHAPAFGAHPAAGAVVPVAALPNGVSDAARRVDGEVAAGGAAAAATATATATVTTSNGIATMGAALLPPAADDDGSVDLSSENSSVTSASPTPPSPPRCAAGATHTGKPMGTTSAGGAAHTRSGSVGRSRSHTRRPRRRSRSRSASPAPRRLVSPSPESFL